MRGIHNLGTCPACSPVQEQRGRTLWGVKHPTTQEGGIKGIPLITPYLLHVCVYLAAQRSRACVLLREHRETVQRHQVGLSVPEPCCN